MDAYECVATFIIGELDAIIAVDTVLLNFTLLKNLPEWFQLLFIFA